jgi:hypothetical protein
MRNANRWYNDNPNRFFLGVIAQEQRKQLMALMGEAEFLAWEQAQPGYSSMTYQEMVDLLSTHINRIAQPKAPVSFLEGQNA